MRVLRLGSVYEAPIGSLSRAHRFDVIGGMQVHTARLTAELDGRGVEQTVITAYRPGAPRMESVGERSRLVRVGVPIRSLRQLFGLSAVPHVMRWGGPDLVHAHLGEDLALVPLARWAARRAGAPLVVTLHCSLRHTLAGHDLRSRALRIIGGRAEVALLGEAAMVLVLSERTADRLVRCGVPRSRVRVIPLGVDLDAFRRFHPRPAVMDRPRWVAYAGRLVAEKGVRDLLACLPRLATRDVGLVIVGDGPERVALGSLALRLGVQDRVRFVGAVAHQALPAYLQHADVVVTPSWYEERGRVVLEAMAAGTPVVASRTGGIPASVTDGESGLLVPPRRPEAIAEAIDRVLGDPRLAASLAAAARTTAAGHDVSMLADATLAAYHSVLPGTRERSRPRPRTVAVA